MRVPQGLTYESFRIKKRDDGDGVNGAGHELRRKGMKEPVGYRIASNCTLITSHLDLLAEEPTLHWRRHSITSGSGEYTQMIEIVRTFAYDEDEKAIEWMVVTAQLPEIIDRLFVGKHPMLRAGKSTDNFAICDEKSIPIVSVHNIWRDNDLGRGVLLQYEIEAPEHPMWQEALWSAFCLRPEEFVT